EGEGRDSRGVGDGEIESLKPCQNPGPAEVVEGIDEGRRIEEVEVVREADPLGPIAMEHPGALRAEACGPRGGQGDQQEGDDATSPREGPRVGMEVRLPPCSEPRTRGANSSMGHVSDPWATRGSGSYRASSAW